MSNIQLFDHPSFGSLTTFSDEDGEKYFKANDICIALRLSNPSQQLTRHVKEKWKKVIDDGLSNSGSALYVSKPGLYALIFRSKTPQADIFQDWVFEEVLPKLDAEGGYIMPSATLEQLEVLQSQVERYKNRIGDLAKIHEEIQYRTGLYEHPRLALDAFTKACSFDFSDADKDMVKYLIESHSSSGSYSWNVSIRSLSNALDLIALIRIPEELLAYWLAEWGYTIKASGGKRLTSMYSVQMLPLTHNNKLKIVESWVVRNKSLKGIE